MPPLSDTNLYTKVEDLNPSLHTILLPLYDTLPVRRIVGVGSPPLKTISMPIVNNMFPALNAFGV